MTLISKLAHTCMSIFAGKPFDRTDALMGVALSDRTSLELARCGQTGASILHSKLSGLY